MFGSVVLDTVIGLVFVFLLVSMLVTIVNEMIAGILLSRAKWLRIGLDRLLDSDWAEKLFSHPLIEGSAAARPTALQGKLGWSRSGPSYIPSRTFANVLLAIVRQSDGTLAPLRSALQVRLDAGSMASRPSGSASESFPTAAGIRGAVMTAMESMPDHPLGVAVKKDLNALLLGLDEDRGAAETRARIQNFIDAMPDRYLREMISQFPGGRIRESLLLLLDDAQSDLAAFKQNVEIWFNNAMDRVGGWYKRRSQAAIAVLAVLATVGLNIDAIEVVRHLQTHEGVRAVLVQQATAEVQNASAPLSFSAASSAAASASPSQVISQASSIVEHLSQLTLPIGWVRQASSAADRQARRVVPDSAATLGETVTFHFLGWLLTALATTLGAPFWFDMLNRVISIRMAGKAPEEKPKPPKDVQTPLEPGQSPKEADAATAGRGVDGR